MYRKTSLCFLFLVVMSNSITAQTVSTDSLLAVLQQSKKEDTVKVNVYHALSRAFRFTDPATAIMYGKQGIVLAKKLNFDSGVAGCYLNVSTAYNYSGKPDTALLYLDTALHYARKVNEPNRLGLAYLNRADYQRQLVNFSQSLKDCDTALYYADLANNDDVRARVNQTFAAVYTQQDLYNQAIPYFDRAIVLYRKVGNLRMTASVYSNMGLLYKGMHDYSKAEEATLKAIHITDSLKDITNLSIFTGNLSDVYFQLGKYTEALRYADKAMDYAVLHQNEPLMGTAGMLQANVYIKQKRFKEAIQVVERASVFFKEDEDGDRLSIAYDLLAEAYAQSGNYEKGFAYMKMSRQLDDSLAKLQYDGEIASMQTKFRVNEKDQQILLLAKEKELQQQRLRQQRIILVASIIASLLVLIGIALAVNRYRLRQQMKELQFRNQVAADLHDEVGSSLSSIHMLSQMASQETSGGMNIQQDILSRMSSNAKETMDKMGDIVWMIKPGESESGNLVQRIERFAYDMGAGKNVAVSLQLQELQKIKLSIEQRKNLYLIFKEAMNNAVKYSGAKTIHVAAEKQGKEVILSVKDDGKGFDSQVVNKGNGLDNMHHRAKETGGWLRIESAAGKGTTVKFGMPA